MAAACRLRWPLRDGTKFMAFLEKCGAHPRKRHLLRSLRCACSGAGTAHPDPGAAGGHSRRRPSSSPSRRLTRSLATAAGLSPTAYVITRQITPQSSTRRISPRIRLSPWQRYSRHCRHHHRTVCGTLQSKYAAFHSCQALKLDIVSTLLLIASLCLLFTFIAVDCRRCLH